ncbi:MAG: hypothetical protein GY805_10050 [Chloroflexi bacterium]|nr:hypothetical protein [Chloroflexota bacterium]
MKRNFFLLFVTLSLSFVLASLLNYESTQAGSPFTTELLSDHSLTTVGTYFNNYGYGVETSGNVAHVYWQESGNNSEGIDLFYRQIPGGSTIQLSDPAMSEGDVSQGWFDTAVAPDGTFHMIWLENTDTAETEDLFYWSAATGTLLLSDRTQTEGYVHALPWIPLVLVLDTNGNPHTFWYEDTDTAEGADLFYWSPVTGTLLLTDRSQTEGYYVNFGPNKLQTDDNGTAHITWAEVGNDGTTSTYFYWNSTLANPIILPNIQSSIIAGNVAHIIWGGNSEGPINYWNSSTQTSQAIPSSSDPGGFVSTRMVSDSANIVHILWSEGNSNVCLSHWDSNSQTTNDLVTGDACYPPWYVYVDDADSLHTIVVDDPMGTRRYRYWNDTLAAPVSVPIGNSINDGRLTGIKGSNRVHLTWIESSGADDNYYHWDNINQTVSNLSQSAGSDTRIGSSQIEQSINGELHMLWLEQINGTGTSQNLYWNSEANTTQNLFTETGINSLTFDFEMTMDFLGNGAPYFNWHGTPISGPEGFYLWDSAQNEVYLAGESLPCTEIGGPFSNDSDIFGNIFLAWQDDSTGTNYFWSEASGQADISLTAASDALCHTPRVKTGDNGRIFVVWIEESDTAGEGLDLYAGWIESSISQVYLPFITK